jgi:hypothetical protein
MIGGDRIDYPWLEAIKILLNAMISDNAQFSTIDLEDFYLGTALPFPEFIWIPTKFIPRKVIIAFYKLKQFIQKGALYCTVLKTHYGLPQAGALSQEQLFDHLDSLSRSRLTSRIESSPSSLRRPSQRLFLSTLRDESFVVSLRLSSQPLVLDHRSP